MRTQLSSGRGALVFLSVSALLIAPGGAFAEWMRLPAQAAQPTQAINQDDWPRRYTAPDGAQIVADQPQVSDWVDQTRLTLHAAVAYTATGQTMPPRLILHCVARALESHAAQPEPSPRIAAFPSGRRLWGAGVGCAARLRRGLRVAPRTSDRRPDRTADASGRPKRLRREDRYRLRPDARAAGLRRRSEWCRCGPLPIEAARR